MTSDADLPPRRAALPGTSLPLARTPALQRQGLTAAKISAALQALAAQPLRSIVSVGNDVGLSRSWIRANISPDGSSRRPAALVALADYQLHSSSIDASLRRLGHAAQAAELAALSRGGDRRTARREAAAGRPCNFDAHKLVAALGYFKAREAARAAGRFDDPALLKAVDEVVGVAPKLVSSWVTTAGDLVKPRESIARLPGYLECRQEIHELLIGFGRPDVAASLLDHVPLRRQPTARALALAMKTLADGPHGSVRAAELASGLARSTLHRFLTGDDDELSRRIGTLPDYGVQADSIRDSLRRMGRDALANALPGTSVRGAAQRTLNSPVPWTAHVFAERVRGNMHKVEEVARLVRAGTTLVDATKQARAHKAIVLPLLDDTGALRDPADVLAMLDGVDVPAERRIREIMSWLSRRLDTEPAGFAAADAATGIEIKRMPAQQFLDRASGSLNSIVAAAKSLVEAPTLGRGASARLVAAPPSVVRLLFDRHGTLQHPLAIERSLEGMDAQARRRLQELVGRLAQRLGQTPVPPISNAKPMRSVMLGSGKFGKPRLLVVDKDTQVPAQGKKDGIYRQNPGLVRDSRSFAQDRHRQPLRWLSTVLKEKFPNSLEVQCYFDPASRNIVISANRTFLNKQIASFVSGGGLAKMLNASPPRQAGPQEDRAERHYAKLVGRMDPASDPHPTELSDAVFAAMAEGRVLVTRRDVRVDGKGVAMHAERRISDFVKNDLKAELDLSSLAGTMRPCGDCAEALGAGPEVHRGPFFASHAAGSFTNQDENRARNERDGVGTSITQARDGRLTFAHDTDSDSDAEFGDDAASIVASPQSGLASAVAARKRSWPPREESGTKRQRLTADVGEVGGEGVTTASAGTVATFD